MTQATYIIPGGAGVGGLTTRTNINAALEAIVTGHKGAAAPSYAVAGLGYWKTGDPDADHWTWYEYDGTHAVATFVYNVTTGAIALADGITATEQAVGDNSGKVATTSYVDRQVGQLVVSETGAVATGATQIPIDDTVPQSIEGDQYMSAAITPKSAASRLLIDITLVASTNAADWITAALFQDSGTSAIAGATAYNDTAYAIRTLKFTHEMASPGTGTYTFKARAGAANGATLTFNGTNGARRLGAVMASSIVIREVF